MARRSRSGEEELPFVALMDTLTNVVGVLIIVMVMIGIGLAKAVNKVLSDLPPVTVEEHANLQKVVEDTKPEQAPETVDEAIAKMEENLKKAAEELKQTKVPNQDRMAAAKIEEIEKKIAEIKKERDQRKETVEKLLAEIDKLKKQLDDTPAYVPPPDVTVKIPNPRPIPNNAVAQHFFVKGDRILYINTEDYRNLVIQELKRNEASLSPHNETVKGDDGKPVMQKDASGRVAPQRRATYEPQKIAEYFSRMHLTGRSLGGSGKDIGIEVAPSPDSPNINIKLAVPATAGETVEQARKLTSEFQTLLRKFKGDQRTVVWFNIAEKGIPTYLALREVVERAGLPVAWDLDWYCLLNLTLPQECVVTFTPSANPSATPPPVVITPPKPTLD